MQLELFPVQPRPVPAPTPIPGKRETSRDAARNVTTETVTTNIERILQFVADCGRLGATRDDIVAGTGIPINVVTARVHALVALAKRGHPGLVETKQKRLTRAGSGAYILIASSIRDVEPPAETHPNP